MYLKDTLKNPLLHMALVFIAGASFHKLKEFYTRYNKKPTRGEKRAKDDTKAIKHLQKKLKKKGASKAQTEGLTSGLSKPERASESAANAKTSINKEDAAVGK